VALGREGMVASAHPYATVAGLDVLRAGGTAADAGVVIHALAREAIDCHFIGQVVERAQGVTLVEGTKSWPMPTFARDEITRLFKEA